MFARKRRERRVGRVYNLLARYTCRWTGPRLLRTGSERFRSGIHTLGTGPEPFEHEELTEPYIALSCCIKAHRRAPLDKTRRVKSFE